MSGVVALTKHMVALGSRYMLVAVGWGTVDTETLAVHNLGGGRYYSSSSCEKS